MINKIKDLIKEALGMEYDFHSEKWVDEDTMLVDDTIEATLKAIKLNADNYALKTLRDEKERIEILLKSDQVSDSFSNWRVEFEGKIKELNEIIELLTKEG